MQQITSTFEKIVKLQPKGLITIPKKMRDELGISNNSILKITKEGKRLMIEPLRTISYPVRSYSKEEINQFIALDKKESEELRKMN